MPIIKKGGNTDPQKQLSIKVRACQRLEKEHLYYIRETKENEEKLEKMKKDETKDPYDIKKFGEVVAESQMMIPDSLNRFQKSLEDLKNFISNNEKVLDIESEIFVASSTLIDKYDTTNKNNSSNVGIDSSGSNSNGKDDDKVEETNVEDLQEGEAF